MRGSHINIWITKGAKVKIENSAATFGWENPAFSPKDSNELASLGLVPLEERVDEVLERHQISFVSRAQCEPQGKLLVQVFVPESEVEAVLGGLEKSGVGTVAGSGYSLLPTAVNVFGPGQDSGDGPYQPAESPPQSHCSYRQFRIEKFYRSIKSRLIVAEVIKRIESGAEFSFDFLCFLVVAACLAFMGLVENSSVILVASMLVSPLMGPILAIVFGTAVRNRKLFRVGVKRELYCLLICVLCGFIFGCIFVVKFNRTRSLLAITSSADWPTVEMSSRTGWSCLVVGLAVAVPSGVGVAISVLGGNSGSSMVGVAISASLLPPAVNTGLYWAMALMSFGFEDSLLENEVNTTDPSKVFKFEYAGEDDIPLELFLRGMVSLTLTVLNILCIIGVGVLILFVKQVTPESIPQRNASFWKTDVALNKEYELSRAKEGDEENSDLSGTFIQALFEEASKDQDVIERKEWIEKNYPITTFPEKSSEQEDLDAGRFQVVPQLRENINKGR